MAAYVKSLERKLKAKMKDVKLHILRSDGGMASAKVAQSLPVNLLMSGPPVVYPARLGRQQADLKTC